MAPTASFAFLKGKTADGQGQGIPERPNAYDPQSERNVMVRTGSTYSRKLIDPGR